ncbi:DNA glycosylase superfamily protein [Actinidia rufa]|uniref:DNA glycosylase superfamily protein n=1 Tax=Actinidia rufa TaxID=165716 RepID=A0A7J0DIG4_9ERIC|nr:DNA glycosylase superfamily protein [Actinidia rufa]
MSGAQRVRRTNVADSEFRSVPEPVGNKAERLVSTRKSLTKPLRKMDKSLVEEVMGLDEKNGLPSSAIVEPLTPQLHSVSIPSVLRRNLSLNASCSSDASSDSFHSRASTGRIYRTNSTAVRRRQVTLKSKN